MVSRLKLPLTPQGRIVTDRTMRVPGHRNVWAIGDAAAVPDPARDDGAPCPPTAQHAIRQGRQVARNVAAELGTGRVRPFRYKTRGVFVDMGQGEAVAQTLGIKWRRSAAWWLARTYHLAMMPGAKRKTRLLLDWNIQLLFGRDASELGRLGHPALVPTEVTVTTGGTPVHEEAPGDGA